MSSTLHVNGQKFDVEIKPHAPMIVKNEACWMKMQTKETLGAINRDNSLGIAMLVKNKRQENDMNIRPMLLANSPMRIKDGGY